MPYLSRFSRFLAEVDLLFMLFRRSGRYDADAFASQCPDYHKDAVVEPAEAAETLLIWVWVLAVNAVGVIESDSRLLERDAMIPDVACGLLVIPLELLVPHDAHPTM